MVFPDGWWFEITTDPTVVEIKLKPSTVAELAAKKDDIDKYIFSIAAKRGLDNSLPITATPATAHFNTGVLSAFGDDVESFVNYFVDDANHPELSLGILGNEDLKNAPPLTHATEAQRKALQKIAQDVNAGKIKSISEAAKRIQDEVYTSSAHYQATGLKYLNTPGFPEEDRPMERRAARQPKSAHEIELMAELHQARISYIKDLHNPAIYQGKKVGLISRRIGSLFMNNEEKANRYFIYLAEMGLSWEKFKVLAGKEIQSAKLNSFVSNTFSWKKSSDVRLLNRYIEDVTTSPWIRKRMLEVLATANESDTKEAVGLLNRLAQSFYRTASPEEAKVLSGFFADAKKARSWNPKMAPWLDSVASFFQKKAGIPVQEHSQFYRPTMKEALAQRCHEYFRALAY